MFLFWQFKSIIQSLLNQLPKLIKLILNLNM